MESPTGATALLRRTEVRWLIAVVILAGCAGVQSGDSGPSQYQTAVQRMMKLSAGALMYVADHDDVFMPRERWMDVLQPYATDAKDYVSPIFDGVEGAYGFALNQDLPYSTAQVTNPGATLLIFDSTATGRNAVASPATMPNPPRYGESNARSYVDGFVPDAPLPPPATQLSISIDRLKQTALGSIMYASDSDDYLCLSDWNDALLPYTKSERFFKSPLFDGTDKFGYAMNQEVVGRNLASFDNPATEIVFFDSTLLQRQAVGPTSTLPSPGRYDGKNAIAFADGHVVGQ